MAHRGLTIAHRGLTKGHQGPTITHRGLTMDHRETLMEHFAMAAPHLRACKRGFRCSRTLAGWFPRRSVHGSVGRSMLGPCGVEMVSNFSHCVAICVSGRVSHPQNATAPWATTVVGG